MHRAALCALAVVAGCGSPQLKQHVADLSKHLPATLEADRPKEGDPRTIKVRVYADAGVRALPKWKEEITDQIDYASQLLTPFVGVRLTIDKVVEWTRAGDPQQALAQLVEVDKGDDVTWVLGYITPGDVASKAFGELGDAEPLGHHAIIRGWSEKPETEAITVVLPDLKEAERAEVLGAHKRHKQTVILLHELATTLGAIAETDPQWIQNPTYSPKQVGFSERNRELIQLAIDERISDGTNDAIAKKLLEAIEKSEWGGWVAPEKELLVIRLRNILDAKKAGKTATDIPPAAYDQITRIKELAKQDKTDDALAELDNVIAAYPGNGSLVQLKCELMLARRPPEKPAAKPGAKPAPAGEQKFGIADPRTRAACKRMSEISPGDPNPHIVIGEALLRAGDLKGAREELAQAEGKIANLPGGAEAAWRKVIGIYHGMGSLTWTEDAITAAKLDKDPAALEIAQTRHRFGVPRGAKFVTPDQEGALVEAVRQANREIGGKKWDAATKTLAAGEKRWPGAPGFDTFRCDMMLARGELGAARAACAKALAAYPEESWALYLTGAIALKDTSAGNTRTGIEELKKAIVVDPELGQAWRTLGKAYERAKDKAARDQLAKDYQAKFNQVLP